MSRSRLPELLAALSLVLGGWSVAGVVAQSKDGASLEACMAEAGNYIYSPEPDLAAARVACRIPSAAQELATDTNESVRFIASMNSIRARFAVFSAKEREACHTEWRTDWAHAHDLVDSDDTGNEDFRAAMRSLPDDLTDIERELIHRSYLEQALSQMAITRYGTPFSYDGASCSYLGFDISLARLNNIVFLQGHDIAAKYVNRQLSPAAYRALWFIVQHADEVPDLQADWLKRFKATYREFGFPELLVNSLQERVKLAEQRKSQN